MGDVTMGKTNLRGRPRRITGMENHERQLVAVIGSGVSGLTAAYILRERFSVTVFEADDRLGGHAHTHQVRDGGTELGVDSGFIVHNDRTYPHLRRLFTELDVEVRPTEMSMSIHCAGCGLEYAGGRGAKGLFAQSRRMLHPRYLSMLWSVTRFQRHALKLLKTGTGAKGSNPAELSYGEFLKEHNFSDYFIAHYAVPIVACVWSSGDEAALQYPARYLFEFLKHHGFLKLKDAPTWFTVIGGSHQYIDKVAAAIGDVRAGCGVRNIFRTDAGVEVTDTNDDTHSFDKVVIATHADQALNLLGDPTVAEKEVLGAFGYSQNETVLHRDGSLLPTAANARAAWNYRMDSCDGLSQSATVSYWMNQLQGITSAEPLIVTLNDTAHIEPSAIAATMHYTHPIFTDTSVAAQAKLKTLFTDQTVYAGAYHGWGFHEDGCRSGVEAAAAWGVEWL